MPSMPPYDNALGRCASGVLLLLALMACAVAPDRAIALQDLSLHLGLIALALVISQVQADEVTLLRINRLLALSPTLLAAVTVAIYTAALCNGQPLDARGLYLGFDNPRFLNHAQTIFVPWLVVVFAEIEVGRFWSVLTRAAACCHVGLAYLGVARGTGIAWGATLIVLVLVGARSQALRFAKVLVIGLVLGVVAFDVLPALLDRQWNTPFASADELGRAHSRHLLWQQALGMIRASPVLGEGPMQFAAIRDAAGAHPHNIYLQWGAEYGVPAACLATFLLVFPVIRALRSAHVEPDHRLRARLYGLAAVGAGILVDGLVSGNFVMPVSQIWIACAYGQLLAANRQAQPTVTSGSSATLQLALSIAFLASQAFLLAVACRQGMNIEPRVHEQASSPGLNAKPHPRFWLNGQL